MAIAGWLLHLFNEEETKPSAQCTPTQRQQTIHQQPCVPIIIMLYISIYLVQAIQQTLIYSVRQNIPLRFLTFFPKPLGIFSLNFTCLLYVPIYAILQIFFIQLSSIMTKLCHIKCDHPAFVSAGGGYLGYMMWTGWHNFIKVADNWIKTIAV